VDLASPGREMESKWEGGAFVLAFDVKDESAWVDKGIDITRSEYEMKINLMVARLGLGGARKRGIAKALCHRD
jgi:hypothetical protein